MRVLLTGGGTGGHIYPALAIANEIKQKYPEAKILFVGNSRGLEADIVPREGFDFRSITVEGLPRKLHRVFNVMKVLAKTSKGSIEAYRILKDFKPTVVVGTGGYVCFSVIMMAALLKIPTLVQEQNALPGRTNRILAHFATKVAVTFPESIRYFTPKATLVVTGLPVRDEVVSADRAGGISAFGLREDKFTILGVGGSQGARSLNRAMVEVIANAAADDSFQVIHVAGQSGYDETLQELEGRGIRPAETGNITFEPYLHNIAQALAAADLVVCRAGATTIAEIEVRGLPAILIPYPYAANNHQEYNARALVKDGAAIMIKDGELTGTRLWEVIRNLSGDKTRLANMAQKSRQMGRPGALKHLVRIITDLSN